MRAPGLSRARLLGPDDVRREHDRVQRVPAQPGRPRCRPAGAAAGAAAAGLARLQPRPGAGAGRPARLPGRQRVGDRDNRRPSRRRLPPHRRPDGHLREPHALLVQADALGRARGHERPRALQLQRGRHLRRTGCRPPDPVPDGTDPLRRATYDLDQGRVVAEPGGVGERRVHHGRAAAGLRAARLRPLARGAAEQLAGRRRVRLRGRRERAAERGSRRPRDVDAARRRRARCPRA